MLESILQWDTLQKILFNTILVSIPEEIYWVMFTLILLGEFDYWKDPECKKLIHRYDYIRILLPAITVALLTNIFRYTNFDSSYSSLITIIVLYILIVLTNDIFGDASALKWMIKAAIFIVLGIITIGISELIYIPLILYTTELKIEEINNDILLNFLISIPSRIIIYSILVFIIIKKRTLLKVSIFKLIYLNPILLSLISIISILNLLFLWAMNKLIISDRFLIDLSPGLQLITIIGAIFIPIINISLFFYITLYTKNKELIYKNNINENLNTIINNIKTYTNYGEQFNDKWKLYEISLDIEKVATSLDKDMDLEKK